MIEMSPLEIKHGKYQIKTRPRRENKPIQYFKKRNFKSIVFKHYSIEWNKIFEDNQPISANDQNNLLANLYHFFEMNIKDMSFENYLKFHNTLPNPSAEMWRVEYDTEQNQPPEELLKLPSFKKFMENMKATQTRLDKFSHIYILKNNKKKNLSFLIEHIIKAFYRTLIIQTTHVITYRKI